VLPAYGIYARHVKDLELANISISFEKQDLRPAAIFTDVDGLQIDNLRAQSAEGVSPAIISKYVRNLSIRNSPSLQQINPNSRD
jgi:hypothetical protein